LHDAFIRPYGGDFLVVILIYCFVKTWIDTPVVKTALGVLVFAYLVEVSQYFHLVNLLGWQNSGTARMLMGTSFSFIDLLTYTLGVGFIIIAEKILNHEQPITT
jgi:DNA integrity scanning protein DisA with diadenylate cyclase activity